MTFASEIQKRSSYRDALVRISVRRNCTTLFVAETIGGNPNYFRVTAPPGPIEAVYRNGTKLNRAPFKAGVPLTSDNLTANEYKVTYFDGDTDIHIKPASPPASGTNVYTVVYTLHYATDKIRAPWNPTDNATELVRWEPRLINDPEVGTYFDNILAGVLSIADTSVQIADTDNVFKNFLTIHDSFRSARVAVWGIVNGTGNIRQIYTGEANDISRNDGTVSIGIVDITNRLRQPAYMGDTSDEVFFSKAGFPSVFQRDTGKPCSYITGESSRYKIRPMPVLFGSTQPYQLDIEACELAVCISSGPLTTSSNRTWGLCRLPGLPRENTFSSITRVYTGDAGTSAYLAGANANYRIGDTILWIHDGNLCAGNITLAEEFLVSGNVCNFRIENVVDTTTGSAAFMGISDVSVSAPAIGITFDYDSSNKFGPLMCRYGYDYTTEYVLTSGSNRFIKITFVNNFEANRFDFDDVGTVGILNPGFHNIYYRISSSAPHSHAGLLKAMCQKAGLAVDASSFTQADIDLVAKTYMQIPTSREDDYNDYLKYAEQVCKSTLGFLAANELGQIVYRLIPSLTGGGKLDEYTSAFDGYSVDYNDIVTGLIGVNQDLSADAEVLVRDVDAEYLHNIKNVVPFYHVLDDINGRLADILAIRKQRKVTYTHTAAHEALERDIGDQATIESPELLGGTGSTNVIITGIRKTMNETTIESTDLGEG